MSGLDAEILAKARRQAISRPVVRSTSTLYKGKGSEAETEKQLAAVLANKSGGTATTTTRVATTRAASSHPTRRTAIHSCGRNWNITAQAALVRSDPALAARLANAAGVQIGSTRPQMQ